MRKGLVNPVLNTIRSANQQSTRYSMPTPPNTYMQSIENMSGSGYNKDSKKLRTLYDDAKGIAIGARPNPEQNKKRFWGLYGQQANTKPYQAIAEMNNDMRRNIDELRYGNTNRRISKNATIKKESYFNTLGGGYDPNIVVQPKKGRPYKGQPDSLPLISKNSKIKKEEKTPAEIWKERIQRNVFDLTPTIQNEDGEIILNPKTKTGRWIEEYGYERPKTITGGTLKNPQYNDISDKQYKNLVDNIADNMIPDYDQWKYVPKYISELPKVSAKPPKKTFESSSKPVRQKSLFDPSRYMPQNPVAELTTAIVANPPGAAMGASALAPGLLENAGKGAKAAVRGASMFANQFAPTIIDQIAQTGKKGLDYVGYSDKIAPYIKNPAISRAIAIAGKAKLPAKVLAQTNTIADAYALASSGYWNNKAESKEKLYNYPTTIGLATGEDEELPLVVSEKTGEAANRKSGNFIHFYNALSDALDNNVANTIANAKSSTARVRAFGSSANRGVNRSGPAIGAITGATRIAPDIQRRTNPALNRYGSPLSSPVLNWLDQNNVLGEASEFEGRKRLPSKFSDLTLREQQEYARFGLPTETRVKPSKLRALREGVVSALTGQMIVPGSYNQNIDNNTLGAIDYWFGDQMSAKGAAQGPLTEVYGYDKNGDLKAMRVSRPDIKGKEPGKNMHPFLQLQDGYKRWEQSNTQDEDLYSKYIRENFGEDFYGNKIPKDDVNYSGYYPVNSGDFMTGVQLSTRRADDSEEWSPNAAVNLSPTYIPETEKDAKSQEFERFLQTYYNPIDPQYGKSTFYPDSQASPSRIGKGMKKSITPMRSSGTNHVVGGLHAKSLTKSMLKNKTLNPSSNTSLKHSNKYSK